MNIKIKLAIPNEDGAIQREFVFKPHIPADVFSAIVIATASIVVTDDGYKPWLRDVNLMNFILTEYCVGEKPCDMTIEDVSQLLSVNDFDSVFGRHIEIMKLVKCTDDAIQYNLRTQRTSADMFFDALNCTLTAMAKEAPNLIGNLLQELKDIPNAE